MHRNAGNEWKFVDHNGKSKLLTTFANASFATTVNSLASPYAGCLLRAVRACDDVERWHEGLHIQPRVERIVFDELAARFDDIAHEDGEHAVGFDGVVLVEVDLHDLPLLGVHGGLEK